MGSGEAEEVAAPGEADSPLMADLIDDPGLRARREEKEKQRKTYAMQATALATSVFFPLSAERRIGTALILAYWLCQKDMSWGLCPSLPLALPRAERVTHA